MSAQTVNLLRRVEAQQWKGPGEPLPDGCHECRPEVHWSAGRKLVYFTYAKLRPEYWMSADRLVEKPDTGAIAGAVQYTPKDGSPAYWRGVYAFAFYDVKSESSAQRDFAPVYLDAADPEMLSRWHDYCALSQWPNPIPRAAEYRDYDSRYGRGYRPVYMQPGDWLLREKTPDGHDNLGSRVIVSVVSDAEFARMREIAAEGEP